MNDLNTLLDLAVRPDPNPVDARADLTRGRHGLARTRTRRGAAGLVGVAAVAGLGVGLARGGNDGASPQVATDPSTTPSASAEPTSQPTPEPTVSPTGAPTSFALPALPEGWEIQGSRPLSVTLARPGDTTSPDAFEGKIAVLLDTNPPAGVKRAVDGREFWVADDTGGGYRRVSVRTRADETTGVLSVQFPADVDWSTDQAIAFLAGIRILEGAEPIGG